MDRVSSNPTVLRLERATVPIPAVQGDWGKMKSFLGAFNVEHVERRDGIQTPMCLSRASALYARGLCLGFRDDCILYKVP